MVEPSSEPAPIPRSPSRNSKTTLGSSGTVRSGRRCGTRKPLFPPARNARRGVGRVGHFEDFLVTPPVAHVPRDIKFGPSPHFLNLGALQTRPPSARAAPNKPVLGAVSEARRFGTASAGSGYRTIRRPGPSRHPSKNLAPLN